MNNENPNMNNESMPDAAADKFEYIDKKGSIHHFKSSEELMEFRQEENNPDNR
jgi:hypothetical protein